MPRAKNTDTDDDCDDQRLFFLTDANMNVTALVQGKSGHADVRKVVERYDYTPYGEVTVINGEADADGNDWTDDSVSGDGKSDWSNSILFAGYRFDRQTGLYHVRSRYYHAPLGVWTGIRGTDTTIGKKGPGGLLKKSPDEWNERLARAGCAGNSSTSRGSSRARRPCYDFFNSPPAPFLCRGASPGQFAEEFL